MQLRFCSQIKKNYYFFICFLQKQKEKVVKEKFNSQKLISAKLVMT